MSSFKKSLLGIGLSLLLATSASAQNQPKVVYMQEHGAWDVECVQDPTNKANKSCLMSSSAKLEITNPDNKEQKQSLNALRASVVYLEKSQPTLILSVLPGTLLIPGLDFKVDAKQLEIEGNKVTGLSFERCLPDGCITGFPLADKKVLETLKKSNKLNVSYKNDLIGVKDNDVKLDISMLGFTAALEDLEKQQNTK